VIFPSVGKMDSCFLLQEIANISRPIKTVFFMKLKLRIISLNKND